MTKRDATDSPMVYINRAEVRRRRQLLGLDQATLAERAGISFSYIAHIERGTRPTVSPAVFVRLCDALGVEDRSEMINTSAVAS